MPFTSTLFTQHPQKKIADGMSESFSRFCCLSSTTITCFTTFECMLHLLGSAPAAGAIATVATATCLGGWAAAGFGKTAGEISEKTSLLAIANEPLAQGILAEEAETFPSERTPVSARTVLTPL